MRAVAESPQFADPVCRLVGTMVVNPAVKAIKKSIALLLAGLHRTVALTARRNWRADMTLAFNLFRRISRPALVVLGLGLLVACGPADVARGVYDPLEPRNRSQFEQNLALDGALSGVLPGEGGTGGAVVRTAIRNVGETLSLPGTIVNDLLQFRPDRAVRHSFRLAINATIGIGGLFDPAGNIGLHGRDSDFGETLHVWGVGEGAYVVLPVLGPTTERDVAGLIVDELLLDPIGALGLRETDRWIIRGIRLAGLAATRIEFADILDANVMQSADPYAQARLLFFQTRRHHLGIAAEDDFIDPYEDF